jgi:hypothetical protein
MEAIEAKSREREREGVSEDFELLVFCDLKGWLLGLA